MNAKLLDTDMLSEVLKRKNPQVLSHARGLKTTGATQQLAHFYRVASTSDVIPIDLPILMRAADLWAEGKRDGRPTDDADLIIAATALETGRVLVTGNTSHFAWISELTLEDWRKPECSWVKTNK